MNVSDVPGWKRDGDGVWHATTAFDGHEFDCFCGDTVDNPERGSWQSEKPRGEVALCSECADRLNQRVATDGGQQYEPRPKDEWTLLEVELDCITRRAKARFFEEFDKREDWKNHEARWHLYKAHDQLSVASYHARQDDIEELMKTNIADAVNHMLMAMATLEVDHAGCQPLTRGDLTFASDEVDRGDGVETDGGTDAHAALEEHGELYLASASRGGVGRAVHCDEDCPKAGADPDEITAPAEIPLRATLCKHCDPDHDINYDAGNNPREEMPAIEDHDDLRADGGQSPLDESPKLLYCDRCVGDTLHSWSGNAWLCDSCGQRKQATTDGAGERIAVSPLTGIIYAVAEYEEDADGRITAFDKRPLSRAEIGDRLDDVHGPVRRAYREHLRVSADA